MRLSRYLSPSRWRRFLASRIELVRRRRGLRALTRVQAAIGPEVSGPAGRTVIADGLWPNPGYILRLRLFIRALAMDGPVSLVGVIGGPNDRQGRRLLEGIGFRRFIHIDDEAVLLLDRCRDQARRMLADAAAHCDLLDVELPHGLPPAVWYDSVVKAQRDGQPAISDPAWVEELAVTLAHLQIYDRLLDETAPELVVLSHLWESEWAVLAWLASQRGLPVFGLSQLTEAIRIRRLSRSEDMLRPVEALSRAYFNGLTDVQQEAFIAAGHGALEERFAGGGTDILIRYAFAPGRRSDHRAEARALLVGDDKRPIGVVYGHSWFDFPHVYGMRNFTDFVDWFRSTLAIIGAIDDVVWLLKPHPMEVWYGGFKMADMIGALPDHVRVLPHETDSLTAMRCADAVVTVHGTVALEAVAEGVPVISADASYFDDWDFCHVAQSRDAYADLLRQVGRLPAPTPRQRDEAAACAMGAFGASPPEVGALRVPCDSRGARLYHEVSEMLMAEQTELDQEAAAIRAFVGQRECDSYQVWRMAEATTRTETPQRVVMRG